MTSGEHCARQLRKEGETQEQKLIKLFLKSDEETSMQPRPGPLKRATN